MPLPGRNYNANTYPFGLNGIIKDDELKGSGNSYFADFRILDPRLGRWLSIDPIVKPWESPYAGFANNPIYFSDPSGLDPGEEKKKGKQAARLGTTIEAPPAPEPKSGGVEPFDIDTLELTTEPNLETAEFGIEDVAVYQQAFYGLKPEFINGDYKLMYRNYGSD